MKDGAPAGRLLAHARTQPFRTGFTLIELIVVILIIGILAAIAVPAYFQSVEQAHAAEAVEILDVLQAGQARYFQKYGVYCYAAGFACAGFDVAPPSMTKYFDANPSLLTPTAPGGASSWALVLTRSIATQMYGQYTIKYDVEATAATFTCTPGAGGSACQQILPPPQ